jgi:hypothetical protein
LKRRAIFSRALRALEAGGPGNQDLDRVFLGVAENGGLLSSILFHGTAEIASHDVMTWEVQQLAGASLTPATIAPD